jgi:8-oxo-dGTP pyrophosphatase MutT (NUDIX family)
MLKIFFDDRVVLLTDNKDYVELFEPGVGLFYPFHSEEDLTRLIELFQINWSLKKVCVFSKELPLLINKFKSLFRIIEAAGGLVRKDNGDLLVIKRKGKWDLPKGKVDENEDIKSTALREVTEECGLTKLTVIKELVTTYHTYQIGNERILKQTAWFEMKSEADETLVPQASEDITEARWIKPHEVISILKNTYLSLFDVFEVAIEPR